MGEGSETGARLAELLAALSLGIDLGFDQPMEHVLRQCRIAMRLCDGPDAAAARLGRRLAGLGRPRAFSPAGTPQFALANCTLNARHATMEFSSRM